LRPLLTRDCRVDRHFADNPADVTSTDWPRSGRPPGRHPDLLPGVRAAAEGVCGL